MSFAVEKSCHLFHKGFFWNLSFSFRGQQCFFQTLSFSFLMSKVFEKHFCSM